MSKDFSLPLGASSVRTLDPSYSEISANPKIDFQSLNEKALLQVEHLLEEFLPDGELKGNEYVVCNPKRDDTSPGSFSINVVTGKWKDFAVDDAQGGDLISLVAYVKDLTQTRAAKLVEAFLAMPRDPSPTATQRNVRKLRPKQENFGSHVLSVPPGAPPIPIHYGNGLGSPSLVSPYRNIDGSVQGYILRFDLGQGKKDIRPLTLWKDPTGRLIWKLRGFPQPHLLYQLDRLVTSSEAPVLVVEGEKSADAAQLLFPGFVVTTAMHGAKSVEKADLTPLFGRNLLIWPDNDEAGQKYAADIAEIVLTAAPSTPIKILQLQDFLFEAVTDTEGKPAVAPGKERPKGWDAADALEEGWTADHVKLLPDTLLKPISIVQPPLPIPGYHVNESGVHRETYRDGERQLARIASRIDVVALTRNEHSQQWGLLLKFKDRDGRDHEWAIPKDLLLSGDGYRQQLLSMGADVLPGTTGKDLLTGYFLAADPKERVLCVQTTGWHGNVFALPNRSFGSAQERVVYQCPELGKVPSFGTAGTLDDWKREVASKCVGNSRLVLSVCTALTGPFLKPMDQENGGLHLRGPSSSGKTKALSVAASVWGNRQMVRSWRTTGNAIEGLAAEHNECVLILDELGQVGPQDAGEIAYTLGNGQSKSRMNRSGNARPTSSWRLLFLSTGEIGLAEHVSQAGGRIRAGQEIRLLDIPSDAGRNLGVFEDLHGASSAQQFADSLQTVSEAFYGTAAEALLSNLTGSPTQLDRAVASIKRIQQTFITQHVHQDAHGQVFRAAGRFGFIAAVGEYCTEIGVLPWQPGEATKGLLACYRAWLENRGGDQASEEVRALAQVRRFLELHGESRFSQLSTMGIEDSTSFRTNNRAGFRSPTETGAIEYFVLPEAYKSDVCEGFDPKLVTKVLLENGLLQKGSNGKSSVLKRLPGYENPQRVYVIKPVGSQEDGLEE